MRRISIHQISKELSDLLSEKDPLEEDIGIFDRDGNIVGVIVPEYAYRFLQEKAEEAEDEIDRQSIEEFDKNKE